MNCRFGLWKSNNNIALLLQKQRRLNVNSQRKWYNKKGSKNYNNGRGYDNNYRSFHYQYPLACTAFFTPFSTENDNKTPYVVGSVILSAAMIIIIVNLQNGLIITLNRTHTNLKHHQCSSLGKQELVNHIW